jgi:hypothetical protein
MTAGAVKAALAPADYMAALKEALSAADVPSAYRAEIVGHFCNAVNKQIAAAACTPAPAADERAIFLIQYDDYDRRPEIVQGETGARERFRQISAQWNAHLFVKVESNTRDDRFYDCNAALYIGSRGTRAWPKERCVGRIGDMAAANRTHMRVMLDSDGDAIVDIWQHDEGDEFGRSASIEFCNGCGGGGRSTRTREALISLMVAMEDDNAATPHKQWPPQCTAEAERVATSARSLTEADFQPVYCVPDGEGKFEHHAERVPLADQEVLYRSLLCMPSELRAAQARAAELSGGIKRVRGATLNERDKPEAPPDINEPLAEQLKRFDLFFTSGNSVPVDRAAIKADDWWKLRASIDDHLASPPSRDTQ